MFTQPALDELDRSILRLLLEDARRSYSDIGSQIGLTAPSVHARVKRLEERGVIKGYTAVIDSSALGFSLVALVAVKQGSGFHWDEIERALEEMPEVENCYSVAGAPTYMLQVRVGNPGSLEQLLRAIASIPAVASTETMLILSTPIERQRIE